MAFVAIFVVAALSSVVENVWLRCVNLLEIIRLVPSLTTSSYWSGGEGSEEPMYYVMIYTLVRRTLLGFPFSSIF